MRFLSSQRSVTTGLEPAIRAVPLDVLAAKAAAPFGSLSRPDWAMNS